MKNINIEWKYIWIDRQETSEKFDSEVITNINFDIVKNSILKYRIHYRKKEIMVDLQMNSLEAILRI